MSQISTILILLFFPLNPLVFFEEGFLPSKEQEEELAVFQPEILSKEEAEGEVKGARFQEESNFLAPPAVPFRKEKVADLKLPHAHSSVILDVGSGTILHFDAGRERRPIASLTKIMTAVLVAEKIPDLEKEIVTVSQKAVYVEGTKIGCPRSGYCNTSRLRIGEKISALGLFQAMLMSSANDAATALAEHVAGSEEKFVEMMNEKARQLELNDTRFCTASGLDIGGQESSCYSTAYDIARLAAYSFKHNIIWETFRLPDGLNVCSEDKKITHQLFNTVSRGESISNYLGGKTGYTPAAGYCLLAASSDSSKKHKVVAVVLDDPRRWEDINKMLSWAFQAYNWK